MLTNQLVGRPAARDSGITVETLSIDLEEFELGLVDFGAVAVASSKVVDDGAVVAARPCGPLEVDLITSSDGDVRGTWGGALVTRDVVAGVRVRGDEAQVLVVREPAGLLRLGGLVDPLRRGAGVPLAAGDDAGDIAVGIDGRQGNNGRKGDGWNGEGVHLAKSYWNWMKWWDRLTLDEDEDF